MKMPAAIQRYWLLTNILLFPSRWLKWAMVTGMVLVLIGLPIYFIWQSPWCAIFGGILMLAMISMSSVAMPNQMLSLNSSKQFGLLPMLRIETSIIYFVFSFLLSVSLTVLVVLKNPADLVQLFLSVFVLVSVYFVVNLLVALRWKWAQGILFMGFVVLPSVSAWLIAKNASVLVGGLIVGWLVFLGWWLSWRPVKFHKNVLGMSTSEMLKNQQEFQLFWSQGLFKFGKIKPQTLIGTLLLGSADGWQARMKNVIFGVVVVVAVVGLIQALRGSAVTDALNRQIDSLFFLSYVSTSFAYHGLLFRNLHKLWVFYSGSRQSLFLHLEKLYYPWAFAALAPLAVMHMAAPNFMSGMMNDLFFTVVLILLAAVLLAFNFYMGVVIYCKKQANYNWVMWVGVGVMFFCMAIAGGLYFVWENHNALLVVYGPVVIGALAGGVIGLRYWAKKCWLEVNFLRVKI